MAKEKGAHVSQRMHLGLKQIIKEITIDFNFPNFHSIKSLFDFSFFLAHAHAQK